MRVAVVGAGIQGVATAHELSLLQHEVTVFERRGSVATEGSFALPGLVAACSPLPWGLPGLPRQRLRAWLAPKGALHARLGSLVGHAPWLWRQARSRPGTALAQALQALAQASQQRLQHLTQTLRLDYEQTAGGLLLISHPKQLKALEQALAAEPKPSGLQLLDAQQARAQEPGLAPGWPLLAAVQLPAGLVGNGRQLAQLLKQQAQKQGARFRFDTTVRGLQAGGPGSAPSLLLAGEPSPLAFDAVVLCAGQGSAALLKTLGLKWPLLAPWAYALTAPLRALDELGPQGLPEHLPPEGPRAGFVDARTGISISRLGQRVRITGISELGGSPRRHDPAVLRQLHGLLESAYPGCAVLRESTPWKGLRPRLPDGAPLLGASGLPGLWLNLGHGAHGWGLACGAAQMLALQISGQPAPVAIDALGPKRWR